MKRHLRALALFALATLLAIAAHAQVRYHLVVLGDNADGEAVNASGLVAGDLAGSLVFFTTKSGLQIIEGPGSAFVQPHEMNESGMVTGEFHGSEFGAFVYTSDTGFRLLEGLPFGVGFGINDDGYVVGRYLLITDDIYSRAFLHDPEAGPIDLGTLGGPRAVANAINNRRQVTGGAQSDPEGDFHPFLWSSDSGMVALPTQFHGAGHAINDRGQVVGVVRGPDVGNFPRAFLYTPGSGSPGFQLIGLPGASPTAINIHGHFVGTQITTDEFFSAAVFYSPQTGMVHLDELIDPALRAAGWTVLQANDINDRGHITGRAFFDGGVRGVLLLPVN